MATHIPVSDNDLGVALLSQQTGWMQRCKVCVHYQDYAALVMT